MVSLVQVVLLIDITYFNCCLSEKQLERYRKKLLLCSLRLITEFGAQTDKGNENVRWSFKFYNSKKFKSDTSQKIFSDFTKSSIIKFDNELQKIISQAQAVIQGKLELENSRQLRKLRLSVSEGLNIKNFDGDLDKVNNSFPSQEKGKEKHLISDSDQQFQQDHDDDEDGCIHFSNNNHNSSNCSINTNTATSHWHQSSEPHSYILNKSLQEILLDYDWDRPDISSPVRKSKLKKKKSSVSSASGPGKRNKPISQVNEFDELNFVIVFTYVPHNLEEIATFSGKYNSACTESDFLKSIFDQPTLHGFKEEKRLRFHLVNISEKPVDAQLKTLFQTDLNKINGGIHELHNLVQDSNHKLASSSVSLTYKNEKEILEINPGISSSSIFSSSNSSHFNKPRREIEVGINICDWYSRTCYKKKHSKSKNYYNGGTFLVWEDENGTSFLKIGVECLSLQGSSKCLGDMYVKSFIQDRTMLILGLGLDSSLLYICHAASTLFPLVLSVLVEQNLIMILQLECGGLAGLVPWVGGVGCLVIFSTTNLISPVTTLNNPERQLDCGNSDEDECLHAFITAVIKCSLKKTSQIKTKEKFFSCKRLQPQVLKSWYPPMPSASEKLPARTSRRASTQQAMLERLQKKYHPQMPRPLSNSHLPPPALVDVTEPAAAAAVPDIGVPSNSISSNYNVSRAQKLVKKSKIMTAQMRVKEQRAEEQEQQAASERMIVEAKNRARKYLALISKTLKNITNPQDKDEVAATLLTLRDAPEGTSEETSQNGKEDPMEPEDLYAIAQAVINLALTHIKTNLTSGTVENELRDVLSRGVLLTAKEVGSSCMEVVQLRQFKLQVMLRLEVLWVLGYSPAGSSPEKTLGTSHRMSLGQDSVNEILKLLRAMSLKYNPSLVGEFLQKVIPHYHEFLGETLVEIFEELNQPLPSCLADFAKADEDLISPSKPSSVQSHASSLMSNGPRSMDEAPLIGPPKEIVKAPARPLLRRETSNRQIVVPHIRRPKGKIISEKEESKKATESRSKTEVKKVCRNLFDRGSKKESLKRSHTIASFCSFSSLSPNSKMSSNRSPCRKSPRRSSWKRKLSEVNSSHASSDLMGASNDIKAEVSTPLTKKVEVLVPETPSHCLHTTIFNRHRLKKSTGSTVVRESPEIKRGDRNLTTGRKPSLPLNRKSSFYSGAVSRNFERGKQQLRASQLKDATDSSFPSASFDPNFRFIFSEIVQSNNKTDYQMRSAKAITKSPFLAERNRLTFGLDDGEEANLVESYKPSSDSRHNLSPSRKSDSESPLRKVRQSLSLLTPVKSSFASVSTSSVSARKDRREEAEKSVGNFSRIGTHPRVSDGKVSNSFKDGMLDFTPSKRVQFNLDETPSKLVHSAGVPAVPKSILKTPCKSPHKTPMKIESLRKLLTPEKSRSDTPRKLRSNPKLVPEDKPENGLNFETIPTQKENKFPSKIVTHFRNSTPRQFDLLLHSPITCSLKKRKPLKESASESLPSKASSQDESAGRKLLSPFNSTLKTSKSPSKGETNWDFKSLVGSPVKFLLNSATDFEITSPSKRSFQPTKTDVVVHEATVDDEAFRHIGQMGLEEDEKRTIVEVPLDQAEPFSLDVNAYECLSDNAEDHIQQQSEAIDQTKLQTELAKNHVEEPVTFGLRMGYGCIEQVLSPVDFVQKTGKGAASDINPAGTAPELQEDNTVESLFNDYGSKMLSEEAKGNEITRHCSNESQNFLSHSRKIFQRDSDSGISMNIQFEEHAEVADDNNCIGKDINKLISLLASPLKEMTNNSEAALPSRAMEATSDLAQGEFNAWTTYNRSSAALGKVSFAGFFKRDISPVEEMLSVAGDAVQNSCDANLADKIRITEPEIENLSERGEGKNEFDATFKMMEDDDDSTTIPSSDVEDNDLSGSPLPELNPLVLLNMDETWANGNLETKFNKETVGVIRDEKVRLDGEVEDTLDLAALKVMLPTAENVFDGNSYEDREDTDVHRFLKGSASVSVKSLFHSLEEPIQLSAPKDGEVETQELDPDNWYTSTSILSEAPKTNQKEGELNDASELEDGVMSSCLDYSPEIPLNLNVKRFIKTAKTELMRPTKRKLKFIDEGEETEDDLDVETDRIKISAKRRKLHRSQILYSDTYDRTAEASLLREDNDQFAFRQLSLISSTSKLDFPKKCTQTAMHFSNFNGGGNSAVSEDKVTFATLPQNTHLGTDEVNEVLTENIVLGDTLEDKSISSTRFDFHDEDCSNVSLPVKKREDELSETSDVHTNDNSVNSEGPFIDFENCFENDDNNANINIFSHSSQVESAPKVRSCTLTVSNAEDSPIRAGGPTSTDNCTPRRSNRTRRQTEKFQSPLSSLDTANSSQGNYYQNSPFWGSREKKSYGKSKLSSPVVDSRGKRKFSRQLYQNESAAVNVLDSSEEVNNTEERSNYLFSPAEYRISPANGRLSGSFEIISPLKRQCKVVVESNPPTNSQVSSPVPEGLQKSPIILRIRRKKEDLQPKGELAALSNLPSPSRPERISKDKGLFDIGTKSTSDVYDIHDEKL